MHKSAGRTVCLRSCDVADCFLSSADVAHCLVFSVSQTMLWLARIEQDCQQNNVKETCYILEVRATLYTF